MTLDRGPNGPTRSRSRRIAQRCPTIADFTLELVNAYLADKILAGATTSRTNDGGTAKRCGLARQRQEFWTPTRSTAWSCRSSQAPTQAVRDSAVPLILAAARDSQQSDRDVAHRDPALACGLRKDEIRQLRWPDDVDLGRAVLWIRDAKTEAGVPLASDLAASHPARRRPTSKTGAVAITGPCS